MSNDEYEKKNYKFQASYVERNRAQLGKSFNWHLNIFLDWKHSDNNVVYGDMRRICVGFMSAMEREMWKSGVNE